MSTQLSTQSQSTSILSALNTAINFAADGVSKLTRLVPDTYHRHITDRSLPSDIHDVAPFVRYIESNASDKLMEIAHGELQALTDHESDSPGANLQQRLNWGKTIGDIESSFEGTNLSDAAVKSSMTVVQGWFYNGSSTPSQRANAKEDITKADRWWTKPVLGGVGTLAAATAYSTFGQYL